MILDSGLVKVTDFGAAKGAMTNLTTRAGQLLGTPNYMSPEQAKGRTLDGRSDIFALGVILYELLTGEKPFYGESVTTVIYKIVHDTPIPPRELDPTIHPGLNFVVSKALAKAPDERYQSCRELVDDLKNYRNLGAMAASNETVVLTRPLAATSRPVAAPSMSVRAAAGDVSPAPRPATPANASGKRTFATPVATAAATPNAAVAATHEEKHSPLAWLLPVALLVLALIVGLILYLKRAAPPVADNRPAASPAGQSSPAQPSSQAQPTEPKAGDTNPSAKETSGVAPSEPPVSRPLSKPIAEKAPKSVGIGTLDIRSNVTGAKILIDGTFKDGWLTPHSGQMPAGRYHVSVAADNYQANSQEVVVTAGSENTVNIDLTPVLGTLRVETTPPGLEVFIDEKSYGPSPVTESLPAGSHHLKVSAPPGGADRVETVRVPANNVNTVVLRW